MALTSTIMISVMPFQMFLPGKIVAKYVALSPAALLGHGKNSISTVILNLRPIGPGYQPAAYLV